jgi:glutamate carboxypeptidase
MPNADVGVLLTTDEEIGSSQSRRTIEASCARAEAVFVTEPAVGGMVKSARKGTSWYELIVHGRAAHAGLDPAVGINSLLAMARLALAISELGNTAFETTVTPTLGSAGTTANTVPDRATVSIDVRAWSPEEQTRIDDEVRALAVDDSLLRGATVEVKGGPSRPAMPESSSLDLVARLDQACAQLGLVYPGARAVGGASDGNFTAALGVATLDGLGAVGDGAHATSEWVLADAMPERAAMLAALILDVLAED